MNIETSWQHNKMSSNQVRSLVSMLSSPETFRSARNDSGSVTRAVVVPSSEHVAQIVGKGGHKIKWLRQSTNTHIKTPLKTDQPVFVVTGTPDNVQKAVESIELAAEHFTKIMDQKSTDCAIGEISIPVEVPSKYVGSAVGGNGRVIKKIKEETNTRINTPKSGSDHPAFIVTGLPDNVFRAKKAIEDKIKMSAIKELSKALYNTNSFDDLFARQPSNRIVKRRQEPTGRDLFGNQSQDLINDIYIL